ncbi:mitochondrial transcription termination factor-related family protein [Populus alba x Populus x berolinensis]|nr:mitochondrial transcription termination factor-related family protein [Populus alba x Populus x berolinensis]
MLATANPLFSSSNSSFLLQATNPSPPIKLQSLATPFTTFSPHGKFTLANFAKASRFLAPVGFPLTKHLLVQCSCLKLPSILRSELGLIYSFFAEMGFNEKESGLLLEQNPALKSASFDSIRAHVLLLESVGIKGVELYHLIDKSPDVLTAKEIVPLIHFVLNDLEGKVEPAQLRRLLIATVPRFLAGFDEKVKLLIKRGIPQEKIVHVLNNVNLTKALSLKSIEEIEKTVTYLSRFGGVDIIVRRPMILNFDLDTQLIPRVELLKEISGGDEDATGIVLHKLPAILSYSVKHTGGHVELLRSFAGLTDPQIFKIFSVFPNVVSASKERKLRPRIEFLKQCGLSSDEIFKFLTKAPVFLGLSFEDNLVHKLVVLVKIGYENGTKELAAAMGAASRTSCENLQNVIGLFLSYGLTYADILAMSKKHPQILQYKCGALEEKLEFLIEEMGREVRELLSFPAFLVKKLTVGEGMSINKLLSVSDDRFLNQKQKKKPIPEGQSERMMKEAEDALWLEKTGAKCRNKVGLLSDEVIADYTRYSCDIYSAISPAYHAFNAHPDAWETDWLRWAHIKKSNINREVRLQNLLLEEQNQMIWIGQKSNITANSLNRVWMEAVSGQESQM